MLQDHLQLGIAGQPAHFPAGLLGADWHQLFDPGDGGGDLVAIGDLRGIRLGWILKFVLFSL